MESKTEMRVVCSESRNATRTDLRLLLECLKFQMKCPDLQKQALLTIHSICEKREDTVDMLREMGGVAFVYNLSKSSIVHSDVKETALFTLGTLAEANVYCKNYLCRKEMFAEIASWLMKDDVPLTQKRVSVYLLSVLVTSNKSGQTLAQTTGCLDVLLDLFRTTFPLSKEATLRAANATQTYQLWASVSSALCGCVNNPQNEEGQHICVTAFPIIKIWLQQISLPRAEIFQPICSFIAMTVANNPCVQEGFSASGCLDILAVTLVRLASAADTGLLSHQLSVTISKTLSACVTDNSSLASGLAQYGVVSHLFSLLAGPHMDPEDRLSVLLTLGHCTEASVEHQNQLVQCGGLPLIITLLTEDTNEEVRKAATFILQTCKQATMSLGVSGLTEKQEEEGGNVEMESFKSSAREMLRRIDLLEKRQAKAEDEQEVTDPSASTAECNQTIPTWNRKTSSLWHEERGENNNVKYQTVRNKLKMENDGKPKSMTSNLSLREEEAKLSAGGVRCSECTSTEARVSSHPRPPEGGREPPKAVSLVFKPSAPVRHSVPKEIKCAAEAVVQEREMSKVEKIPGKEKSSHIRCAGCVVPFEEVTSRTFAALQTSCHQSCDMHRILHEATERFRTRSRRLPLRDECQDVTVETGETVSEAEPRRSTTNEREFLLTPVHRGAEGGRSALPRHRWNKHHGIVLIPRHRGAKGDVLTSRHHTGPILTPLKGSSLPEERRRGGRDCGHRAFEDEPNTSTNHGSSATRRKRTDFSHEEVRYLLSGVKTYGFSWNSILWSYPFQPGRTNVGLAKKYRQLMKSEAQD